MSSRRRIPRALATQQAMERARRGSKRHLQELLDGLNENSYDLEAVSILLGHLERPSDNDTLVRMSKGPPCFVMIKALRTVIRLCPPSLVEGVARQILSVVSGITLWVCLIGSPEDLEEQDWTSWSPDGRSLQTAEFIYHATDILACVMNFHETVMDALLKEDAILHMIVMWWTTTSDEDISVSSWEGKVSCDFGSDSIIWLFHTAAAKAPQELSDTIEDLQHDADACTSALFTTRTIQRMRALLRPKFLPHLCDPRDWRGDHLDMERIVAAMRHLMTANSDLRDTLLQEKTPEALASVLSVASSRCLTCPMGTIMRVTSMTSVIHMFHNIVKWPFDAPYLDAISSMKGLVASGLLQVVGDYCTLRPRFEAIHQGETDRVAISMLSLALRCSMHPKVAPTFLEALGLHSKAFLQPVDVDNADFTCVVVNMFNTFLELPLKHGAGKTSVCDNLNHRLRLPNSTQVPPTKFKSCSHCRTAMYCSSECQEEDWIAQHRQECHRTHLECLELKAARSWPSLNLRKFHLGMLLHVCSKSVSPWSAPQNQGLGPPFGRTVAMVDIADTVNGFQFIHLETYTKETGSLLPQHKLQRFQELVARFKLAAPLPDRGAEASVPLLSLELINGVFFFGDCELNYVVLLRRRKDTELQEHLKFDVEGHLMYICQDVEVPSSSEECANRLRPLESWLRSESTWCLWRSMGVYPKTYIQPWPVHQLSNPGHLSYII